MTRKVEAQLAEVAMEAPKPRDLNITYIYICIILLGAIAKKTEEFYTIVSDLLLEL